MTLHSQPRGKCGNWLSLHEQLKCGEGGIAYQSRFRFVAPDVLRHRYSDTQTSTTSAVDLSSHRDVFAEPTSWNAARARLIGLEASELDDLGPLLGFVGEELAKVGGRAWKRSATKVGKARLHAGVGKP